MNESTGHAQTSRFAQKSHFLGVLSLLLLLLCGFIVFQAICEAGMGLQVWQPGPISIYRFADICAGVAGLAALDAIVQGILGLVDIRQGESKVKGRSQAVSGVVTGPLTLLPLMLVLVVLMLGVPRDKKLESYKKLQALGLAMHLYADDHGCLPPAVLRDPWLGDRGQPYSR
jgi:hypothetical protein